MNARFAAAITVAVLFTAACGGGGGDEAEVTTTASTTPAAPTTTILQTTTTKDPLWVEIDASKMEPMEILEGDFAVADSFNRCDIYAPEVLTRLLERRFSLVFDGAGYDPGFSGNSGACIWDTASASDTAASVVLRLAALSPEAVSGEERADPAMGDSAVVLGDIWRQYCSWADPVWEMLSSTDGPGVAFRVGNAIAQVNVVLFDEADSIDQLTAELVLAQNISRRLANADFTPCKP